METVVLLRGEKAGGYVGIALDVEKLTKTEQERSPRICEVEMRYNQKIILKNGKEAWLRNGDAADGRMVYVIMPGS